MTWHWMQSAHNITEDEAMTDQLTDKAVATAVATAVALATTREEREAWRGDHHKERDGEKCWGCDEPWPCPTVRLLDDLERAHDAYRAVVEAARPYAAKGNNRLWNARGAYDAASPEPTASERKAATLAMLGTGPEGTR